ncbi:MAG: hypothetical protein ACXVKH_17345, partial [Candidatus Angelobacter sp.]
ISVASLKTVFAVSIQRRYIPPWSLRVGAQAGLALNHPAQARVSVPHSTFQQECLCHILLMPSGKPPIISQAEHMR